MTAKVTTTVRVEPDTLWNDSHKVREIVKATAAILEERPTAQVDRFKLEQKPATVRSYAMPVITFRLSEHR